MFQRRCSDGQQVHENMFNILNIKEMQIATTVRHHFIPVRMAIIKKKDKKKSNVGEDVENREPLYTVGETGNWCSHYGRLYGESTKN